MRIRIRSADANLFLPVPLRLVGMAIALTPKKVFCQIQKSLPEQAKGVTDKAALRILYRECYKSLKKHKGLEIVHVEASDGTFVSVRL